MSVGNILMLRDLGRMASEPVQQLAARVSHDPNLISEAEFQIQHGMSKAAYAERQRIWARDAYEQEVTADLDGSPPLIDVPDGLTPKRQAWFRFSRWLSDEESTLAALEAKRAELQSIIAEPVSTEGALRQMVRRTADTLLGKGREESDATAWAALESQRVAQQHRAAAAQLAIEDLEQDLEISRLRVDHLRNRLREFLSPCIFEAAEGIQRILAHKRAQVAALEKALNPLSEYSYYGLQVTQPEQPSLDIRWKHSWDGIANALQADPATDISRMLPNPKF